MKKTLLLYQVISKCSSQSSSSGSASKVGYIILGILGAVLVGFCGYTVGNMLALIQALTGLQEITTPLFMVLYSAVGLIVFFVSIPTLLRTMFMSTDIDVLAAMPLTATQIAMARLLAGSRVSCLISVIVILPFMIGFSISAGVDGMLIVSAIVATIIVPIGSIAVVAILLTVIMKVFRIIRNRNLMAWVGAIAGIILVIVLCMASSSSEGTTNNQMAVLVSALVNISDFAWSVPFAACCGFAISAGALYLALGILAVAILAAIAYLVLSKLYLSTALGMVNSRGSSTTLDDKSIEQAAASQSVEKALLRKEIKTYFKDPSYVMSWAVALVFPLIIFVPGIVNRAEDGSLGGLCSMVSHFTQTGFGTAIAGGVLLGLALSFVASAMSAAGTSCISREGEGFDFMKTIPVDYMVQLDAKRKLTIIALAIPSTLYIVLGGVIGIITGTVAVGFFVGALLSNIASLILIANWQMRTAAKKANVHWDNKQVAVKSSAFWLVLGLVLFTVFLVGMVALSIVGSMLKISTWALLGGLLLLLVVALLAFLTTKPCLRYAAQKLAELR